MAMKIEQEKEFKLSKPEKERLEIELGTEKGKREGKHKASEDEKDIVSLAVKQYKAYHVELDEEQTKARDDIRFVGGDHWFIDGKDIKAERTKNNKLSFTKNRAPGFIDNVTGDVRQNMPRIKYRPTDSNTDPKLAEIYNSAILYMQAISRAHRQYIPAFEQACTGGYPGWCQLVTEFVDPAVNDEQDIFIKFIPSQFGPALDHTATDLDEPGKGGPKWGHVPKFMTWVDFNDEYPNATAKSWDSVSDKGNEWFKQEGVTVCSYYKAVPVQETRHDFDDPMQPGSTKSLIASSAEYKAFTEQYPDAEPAKSRKFFKWRIDHYVINGSEVLKGPEVWAGKFIPIIPFEGKWFYADGKKQYRSVYREAKDANRMENWMASEMIELMADEPYIGSPEMIEGHEEMWDKKNKKQYGFLYAKPDNGLLPRKEDNGQKLSSLFRSVPQMIDDEKSLTNIYSASRGETSNETSGRAINARDAQSNTTNFAFVDNGIITPLEYIALQFSDLFPKIYDYEKTLKIIGEDEREQGEVTINKTMPVPGTSGVDRGTVHEFRNTRGEIVKRVLSDLAHVRFDITVDVGPGMKTQRMEAVDSMIRMSQGNSVFAEASSGQVARMLDYPDAEKIAERTEFILNTKYPGIDQVGKDEEGGSGSPQAKTQQAVQQATEQIKQQMMPVMQQSADMIERLQAEIQKRDQEAQSLKAKIDAATIAMKDATTKQAIQGQEFDLSLREEKLQAEADRFKLEAEKEMLRIEAAKAAQNDLTVKSIAELQAQLDSMKTERMSMMTELMGAIDKDNAEKPKKADRPQVIVVQSGGNSGEEEAPDRS